MKSKSAQVTIFVIIAILIIAGISLYFVLRKEVPEKTDYSPETEGIYNFVQECLEQTSEEVIYNVGQRGGYYFPPELSTESGIPYYLINGKNYVPTKAEIENEISKFVSEKLFFCTRNFIGFSEYEIEQGEIKTKTQILEEVIILNTNYPLTISKGNSSSRIEDFEIIIPVCAGIVYNSVLEFLNTESEYGEIELREPNTTIPF